MPKRIVAQLLPASHAKTVQVPVWHGDVVHATGNKVPGKPGAGEFFVMSALAKLGATILTYPILLVKSRLQAASKHTHADLQYSGTYDALKRIWQKEGQLLILPSEIQTALCMHCTEWLALVAMKRL